MSLRVIGTLLITILAACPLGAQVLALPQALRSMLQYEPELNAAEYDTLSSIENIKVFRSERAPQVGWRGSVGVSNRDRSLDGIKTSGETLFQRQMGVALRQLLYDGGVSRNNQKASENAMMAQQYLEKSMVEERTVDLAEVYMEILRSSEQITLARENVANHDKMVGLIKTKLENGGFRSEVRLAESRLDRARHLVSSLELAFAKATARFARLTGQNQFALRYPQIPHLPDSREKVSLEDNWDYLAATEALEEAEQRAKAVRSEFKPKVYLDAGYSVGRDVSGFSGQDDEASALIVGEWTLFDGGKRKAVEKREHYQVGKFEELKRAADLARHHELEMIWQQRESNRKSMEILSSYKNDLQEVVTDYEQRFTMGREDLLNILDMQAEHYAAASDLIDANYDYDTNAFRVLGKQGRLAEWLLRLAGENSVNCSLTDGKNPQVDAIPVALGADEDLKDKRVPLTQKELMLRVFDGEGPTAEYDPAPMEQYYKVETNSRKGWVRRIFERKNQAKSDPDSSTESEAHKISPSRTSISQRPHQR